MYRHFFCSGDTGTCSNNIVLDIKKLWSRVMHGGEENGALGLMTESCAFKGNEKSLELKMLTVEIMK